MSDAPVFLMSDAHLGVAPREVEQSLLSLLAHARDEAGLLINAYKTVAALALQVTPVVERQIEVNYSIEFDYTLMNEVMILMKQFNSNIISNEMQLFCIIKAGIPKNRLNEVLYRLNDLKNVSVKKIG